MRSATNQSASDVPGQADEPDFEMLTIERLRARAVQCRNLGDVAHSTSIAAEFERLAKDYEADALRLEAILPRGRLPNR